MEDKKKLLEDIKKADPHEILDYFESLLADAYRLEQEKETEDEKLEIWGELYDRLFCIPITGDYRDDTYEDMILGRWPDFSYDEKNKDVEVLLSDKSDVECLVRSFKIYVEQNFSGVENMFPSFDQWREQKDKEIKW